MELLESSSSRKHPWVIPYAQTPCFLLEPATMLGSLLVVTGQGGNPTSNNNKYKA